MPVRASWSLHVSGNFLKPFMFAAATNCAVSEQSGPVRGTELVSTLHDMGF